MARGRESDGGGRGTTAVLRGQAVRPLALPESGERWVALAEYLIETSRDPEEDDIDAASRLLYPAEGICSDAVEEAV